jgi:hypothetical protein
MKCTNNKKGSKRLEISLNPCCSSSINNTSRVIALVVALVVALVAVAVVVVGVHSITIHPYHHGFDKY